MTNVKLLVASHKPFDTSNLDRDYYPILVGANQNQVDKGFKYKDNENENNISSKNAYYSELTALYWAWQNLNYDTLGLEQYRRFLTANTIKQPANSKEIEDLLAKHDLLLPKKRYYIIETLESHYANTFDIKHLQLAREIIAAVYPDYLKDFDRTMQQRSGYMFNLFIMKKKYINQYAEWLFKILFKMEDQIDFTQMDAFNQRLLGRVSELLFNVWLHHELRLGNIKQSQIKTLKVYYVGGEPVIKKGIMFLKAKFCHQKYTHSA